MTGRGPRSIPVRAGGGALDYPVLVGPGALEELPERVGSALPAGGRAAVISDSNVAPIHGEPVREALRQAGVDCGLFTFPAGERNKDRTQWAALTDALLDWGLGRDGVVVAVGGGVTGDLAGFVAATYLRGIPVVQVPTSLVAMVDASVGGKTGVDTRAGKNLVGAFHPPRAVVADPDTLATLPRRERSQGLAEVLKHGAILDGGYFREVRDRCLDLLEADREILTRVVARSVELKAEVVSRDEREGGLRQILNFGHTLGHALEAASGFSLAHGDAVALGMVLEARLGEALGVTEAGVADALREAAGAAGLATEAPAGLDPDAVIRLTAGDKKARGGGARYVLLAALGRVHDAGGWTHPAPEPLVREILAG